VPLPGPCCTQLLLPPCSSAEGCSVAVTPGIAVRGKKRQQVWPRPAGREGRSGKPVTTKTVPYTLVASMTWTNRESSGMASSLRGGIFHSSGVGVPHPGKPRWGQHPAATQGLWCWRPCVAGDGRHSSSAAPRELPCCTAVVKPQRAAPACSCGPTTRHGAAWSRPTGKQSALVSGGKQSSAWPWHSGVSGPWGRPLHGKRFRGPRCTCTSILWSASLSFLPSSQRRAWGTINSLENVLV